MSVGPSVSKAVSNVYVGSQNAQILTWTLISAFSQLIALLLISSSPFSPFLKPMQSHMDFLWNFTKCACWKWVNKTADLAAGSEHKHASLISFASAALKLCKILLLLGLELEILKKILTFNTYWRRQYFFLTQRIWNVSFVWKSISHGKLQLSHIPVLVFFPFRDLCSNQGQVRLKFTKGQSCTLQNSSVWCYIFNNVYITTTSPWDEIKYVKQ